MPRSGPCLRSGLIELVLLSASRAGRRAALRAECVEALVLERRRKRRRGVCSASRAERKHEPLCLNKAASGLRAAASRSLGRRPSRGRTPATPDVGTTKSQDQPQVCVLRAQASTFCNPAIAGNARAGVRGSCFPGFPAHAAREFGRCLASARVEGARPSERPLDARRGSERAHSSTLGRPKLRPRAEPREVFGSETRRR